MIRYHAIPGFIHVVCDDEEQVEAGKEGVGKGNIFVRVFMDVVL